MNHQKAFDEMMIRYRLEARKLAGASGVSEVQISRLRNGKDLYAGTLLDLLSAVPTDAREYFLSLVFGAKPEEDMRSLVMNAKASDISELLALLAERVNSDSTVLLSHEYAHSLR